MASEARSVWKGVTRTVGGACGARLAQQGFESSNSTHVDTFRAAWCISITTSRCAQMFV